MQVHHDKHHAAYVEKANAALADTDSAHESVEHVLSILETFPEEKRAAIRNNAGGHANHSLFWEIMSPTEVASPRESQGRRQRCLRLVRAAEERSTTQASTASGRAGRGSSTTARASRSIRLPTRTP